MEYTRGKQKVRKILQMFAVVAFIASLVAASFYSSSSGTEAAGKKAVKSVSIKAGGVKKNGKTITVKKGGSLKLTVSVSPASAKKSVSWKSSNPSVASVKGGKVTAKKAGTAKITAKVKGKNGKVKKAWVKVKVSGSTGSASKSSSSKSSSSTSSCSHNYVQITKVEKTWTQTMSRDIRDTEICGNCGEEIPVTEDCASNSANCGNGYYGWHEGTIYEDTAVTFTDYKVYRQCTKCGKIASYESGDMMGYREETYTRYKARNRGTPEGYWEPYEYTHIIYSLIKN